MTPVLVMVDDRLAIDIDEGVKLLVDISKFKNALTQDRKDPGVVLATAVSHCRTSTQPGSAPLVSIHTCRLDGVSTYALPPNTSRRSTTYWSTGGALQVQKVDFNGRGC